MRTAPRGGGGVTLFTHEPFMPAGGTMLDFIAATAGAGTCTTAITLGSGTIRDFMDGAGIPGELRFTGASAHGVGEVRHGGDSMAGGGILIPFMRLRTTG